jgi:uncharacterized protein (TIGR00299 family) protein
MTLGALLDLGLPVEWLEDFVAGLGLANIAVRAGRVQRHGIDCAKVDFDVPAEHAHRHLRHVLEIVDRAGAPERARRRAAEAFRRIAQAEADVHGTTVETVHFHEVGALDAILDVVCCMAAVEQLGFETFFTRPIALGSGWVDIAHGRFPVPAPATLRILEGLPATGLALAGECTTPTGAAILATLTEGRCAIGTFVPKRTGFGAGSRDDADRPNCLRLVACEVAGNGAESLYVVQADVDDLPPEYVPAAQEALLGAGALDASVVSIAMKKGRPGTRVEALVGEAELDRVLETLFRATTTIGARYWAVTRPALARAEETRDWKGQSIRMKRVTLPGGTVRSKPEYEDVVRAARALGLTPFEVRRALDADDAP